MTDVSETEYQLNGKLVKERRIHPLIEVPERIGDKVEVAPETFFNFLGQNYLSFFTSLDDVVKATEHLSDAALIFSRWNFNDMESSSRNFKVGPYQMLLKRVFLFLRYILLLGYSFKFSNFFQQSREAREEFGLSISIRGLMHSNNARVASTWKPLRKPGLTILNARAQATYE